MRVIFLDIDGVLNSTKTYIALGAYPKSLNHRDGFDWIAIKLLQRLCDSSGVQIVLSSAWRLFNTPQDVAKAFDLPVIDVTPRLKGQQRGHEIQAWLLKHPKVTHFAILDDDDDMLPAQKPHFVHTNTFEGMTWHDFVRLCDILGESAYAGEARDRHWMISST